MSSHDIFLLWLGAGFGALTLLLVWMLLELRDDKRRAQRDLIPAPVQRKD